MRGAWCNIEDPSSPKQALSTAAGNHRLLPPLPTLTGLATFPTSILSPAVLASRQLCSSILKLALPVRSGLSASARVLDVLPTPLDEGARQVDVLHEAHDIDCRLMAVDRGPGSCGQGDYIAHSWQDGYGNGGDGAMLR